ncbi:hypothetical protein J437_LFUL004846 [Ladona fulva]|uniref:Bestrophin homolog n=1 Tax=Ladona fulva TaxID=123851 RepID=A0A8K0K2V0_LADFU|nr:hypothetical protein J437_LFUL004846 [Ladona fulva]
MMHCVALYVNGDDESGRLARRTLMRYLNLSLVLVLRSISSAVKRRFPTLEHVVDSGFMTDMELEMYRSVPNVEFNTYWIPCTWFISLLKEARQARRITDSNGLKIIMEEFSEFRSKCGLLWSYDWVSIPLVYTQVVTIATYSFFMAALVGRQFVEGKNKPYQMEVDIYVPVFTILQFFFFMGLLKVAEQLINPFGDDDEDFELNWLIDRHIKVSYLGVDTLLTRVPPVVKDMYFNATDLTLPYTKAAVAYKKKTYRGSVHDMMVPQEKQSMYLPEIVEEEEETETEIDLEGRIHNPPTRGSVCSYSQSDLASRSPLLEGSTPIHTRRGIPGSDGSQKQSQSATSEGREDGVGRSNFSSQILVGSTEGNSKDHSDSSSSVEEVVMGSSTGDPRLGDSGIQMISIQPSCSLPSSQGPTSRCDTPGPSARSETPGPSYRGETPESSGAGPPKVSSRRRPSTASSSSRTKNVVRWKPLEGSSSTPFVTSTERSSPFRSLMSATKGCAKTSLERLARIGRTGGGPLHAESLHELAFKRRVPPMRAASLPDMGTPLSVMRSPYLGVGLGENGLRRVSEGGQEWPDGGETVGEMEPLQAEQNNGVSGRLRPGGSNSASRGRCWPV